MNTSANTITANEAFTAIQKALELSPTKRFTVITDAVAGRVVFEPFDEEDAKPYYELSREGEASLKHALEEEAQGLGKPLSALTL